MGACMSTANAEETERRKISQMIDRRLEEDSRRYRRECKILLLGRCRNNVGAGEPADWFVVKTRLGREWQVDNREANENHTSKWIYCRGAGAVQDDHLQELA